MQEEGKLEKEGKKQASRLKREMRKIKGNLEGVREMSRLPGAVVVVDAKKEYIALREASKLGIATVGLIDTDSDPDTVDVAIPTNDDSMRAVDLILNELADAVAAGKTMVSARQEAKKRPKRVRSGRSALARASEEEPETVTASTEKEPTAGQDGESEQAAESQAEPKQS